ncbi:MAG: hypothetical protein WDZ75_01965 [Candidatus Paceibacterota bacterium]
MINNSFNKKNNKGFALLFSIVVVSVVVITTLAVSSLVRRGLELTSIGERSMEAFFAADAGLECALYWDIEQRDSNDNSNLRSGFSETITCLGSSINVTPDGNDGSSFSVRDTARGVCADVEVEINGLVTTVQSRGFNTCDTSDPGRIERGLQATY